MGPPLSLHVLRDASPEALIALWQSLCGDPAIAALPYKVETNERGQLLMSPAHNPHSFLQARISAALLRLTDKLGAAGMVVPECAVMTAGGIKAPDAAWVTPDDQTRSTSAAVMTAAPSICIEVMSPSNSAAEMDEKTALYLGAGAREVWICDEQGGVRFFHGSGEAAASALFPDFPSHIEQGHARAGRCAGD